MADDRTRTGSPDSKRINMSQEHEKEYWKKKLGASGQALAGAIRAVGTSAQKVRAYLKSKSP